MKPDRHAREQGGRPQPLALEEITLDPDDWEAFRAQAHGALDTMVDYLRDVRDRPAWQPLPEDVKNRLRETLPEQAQGLEKRCSTPSAAMCCLILPAMSTHASGAGSAARDRRSACWPTCWHPA